MRSLLRQGVSHPEFYGDVVYKLRKIHGHILFDFLFRKRIRKFVKCGYDPIILQRTARLVVSNTTVDHHSYLFNCTMATNS